LYQPDAEFESLEEVPYELIKVEDFIAELRRAKGVRIALIDACRDNDADEALKLTASKSKGVGLTKGLARVANAEGLIVVYATQFLTTAEDGDGANSPFAAALVDHLPTPGEDVKNVLVDVANDVRVRTHGKQTPEVSLSLFDPFVLNPAAAPIASAGAATKIAPAPGVEVVFWQSIVSSTRQEDFRAYLQQFPDGVFAALARSRIAALGGTAAASPSAPAAQTQDAGPDAEPCSTSKLPEGSPFREFFDQFCGQKGSGETKVAKLGSPRDPGVSGPEKAARAFMGLRIQDVTEDIAVGLGLKQAKGALVAGASGPAAEAGIVSGDIIIEFDGQPVDGSHAMANMITNEAIGKEVQVKILRKGEEETLTVKLGRLEDTAVASADNANPPADNPPVPAAITGPLGLTLSNMSPAVRSQYGIKDSVSGVVVTGVSDGSAAAEKRVHSGDVIVEIAQEPVASADDVIKRIDQLKQDGRKAALLLVANKDGDLRYVAVKID
jgi:type II secretory pathway component PulC